MTEKRAPDIDPDTDASLHQANIEILLHEYDVLHAELVSRMNSRFAILGYVGAVVAFVWTFSSFPIGALIAVTIMVGAGFAAFWLYFGELMKQSADHIYKLEERVNAIAGAELLTWMHRVVKESNMYRFHR